MTRHLAILCVTAVCVAGGSVAAAAEPPPSETRLVHATGEIVPIPASIPHEEGDMIDKRLIPQLRWIAERYPIYVTDGYSGRLPGGGEHAGCRGCHVKGSDHHVGLAVDIVPLIPSSRCDARWNGITRLARWAEPRRNKPIAPFRWVGYDGDTGHGCGHHLHLSWNHAATKSFQIAEWVEVFAVTGLEPVGRKTRTKKVQKAPRGPSGGISKALTGGVSPRGSGD